MTRRRVQNALLLLAVVLFIGSTAWNVASRVTTQSQTTTSIETTIQAIQRTCEADRLLTDQYRVRGKDERILAGSVLLTTTAFLQALAESGPPPQATAKETRIRAIFLRRYEATVPRLRHILATIKILPVIDCKHQAHELRQQLPPG